MTEEEDKFNIARHLGKEPLEQWEQEFLNNPEAQAEEDRQSEISVLVGDIAEYDEQREQSLENLGKKFSLDSKEYLDGLKEIENRYKLNVDLATKRLRELGSKL